jgi:vancomycin permeability regulator SanA
MNIWIKKILRIGIILTLFFGVNFLIQKYFTIQSYSPLIFSEVEKTPNLSVALVFGAGVKANGKLSDALADRVLTGVELYKAGKVKKLLMSGDNSTKNYDEVTAMKNFAIEKGVPEGDIVLDYAGFDTYDSCYRAREIFDLHSGIILVSQAFHLSRALYICNSLGVQSVGVSADKRIYATNLWGLREFAAQIKAIVDVEILHSKPKFLGPKVKVL